MSLRLLSSIHANPSKSIIDVGCGASLLVDNLIGMGYRSITLLDLSEHALSSIRTRLGDKGDIPIYLNRDITSMDFNHSFDIWHDRAVFHFLTDPADRRHYMSNLGHSLADSGHAVIGTFSLNGPNTCSGLNVVQYDEERMESQLPEGLELIDATVSTHVMPSGTKQEYMYFIIRRDGRF